MFQLENEFVALRFGDRQGWGGHDPVTVFPTRSAARVNQESILLPSEDVRALEGLPRVLRKRAVLMSTLTMDTAAEKR